MALQRQPGIANSQTAQARHLFKTDQGRLLLPAPLAIDGSESRDPENTGALDTLRAGLLLGKVTATGKMAPAILDTLAALHDTSAVTTSLTLPVAAAVELDRRVGQAGSIGLVGPPTAAGTVVVEEEDFSAVNTTTGVVTLDNATAADFIAGSFVYVVDGTFTNLIGYLADAWGIRVTDEDNNDIDVQPKDIAIGGMLDVSQIINYPSDTSIIAYLKNTMLANHQFLWSDDFD